MSPRLSDRGRLLRVRALDIARRRHRLRVASTRAELERILRLRYDVYVDELNRPARGQVDHARRTLSDAADAEPGVVHAYVERGGVVIAAVRVRCWSPGRIPQDVWDHHALDRLPGIEQMIVCDTSYLAVQKAFRSTDLAYAIATASGSLIMRERGVQLALATCSPGLVDGYRRLGFRITGAPVVEEDVLVVPLACVTGDLEHARRSGALWYPALARSRRSISPRGASALSACLDDARGPIVDPSAMIGALRAGLPALCDVPGATLARILGGGLVLDLPPGMHLITAGALTPEVHLLVEGCLIEVDGGVRRSLEPGTFIQGSRSALDAIAGGRRVYAGAPCRVATLRGRWGRVGPMSSPRDEAARAALGIALERHRAARADTAGPRVGACS